VIISCHKSKHLIDTWKVHEYNFLFKKFKKDFYRH
jgi:hypothetical protein